MADKRSRLDRLQNLAIALLTLSALALLGIMPLFGALSDQSLFDLAVSWLEKDSVPTQSDSAETAALAQPLRMVLSNDYTRLGIDALTTQDDAFNPVGSYLSEALGSAVADEPADEAAFLAAMRGTGLYFDFTVPIPLPALAFALGVRAPEMSVTDVRRALLCPGDADSAILYLQDGAGVCCRSATALSAARLSAYLSALDGNGADFALLAGGDYAALSPYTLLPGDSAGWSSLSVSTPAVTDSSELLRRAEFNAHTENRYVESSGTVIVRETSSTLHLNPNGTVSYQGSGAGEGSIYAVSAAADEPTVTEAIAAAEKLIRTLTQDLLGDAAAYLAAAEENGDGYDLSFDYMLGGTPIRFPDGSHAASVSIRGKSVAAFTIRYRRYAAAEDSALLLPLRQAAAIARSTPGAELSVVYVDGGGDTAAPTWVAD